jgi:hypothetical protein
VKLGTKFGFLLGLLLSLGGCARGFQLQTPDGFAELDDGDYAYRATSAEGVVIAVRREANDPKANLAFWSAAVDYELRRKGYTARASKEVKSAEGVPGKQIRYEATREGRPNVLWTTVFVTGKHVVVVEAGGDSAHFERVEADVEKAIKALELS